MSTAALASGTDTKWVGGACSRASLSSISIRVRADSMASWLLAASLTVTRMFAAALVGANAVGVGVGPRSLNADDLG